MVELVLIDLEAIYLAILAEDDLSWDQCLEEGLVSFLKRVVEMQGHFQIWKVKIAHWEICWASSLADNQTI